jgi:hypothetical protein
MTLQLQASGSAQKSGSDIGITLSSSSVAGSFSTGDGVWTSTLALTIPAGAATSSTFYYEDTRAGSPVLTATASGVGSGTQTEAVNPAALAGLSLTPTSVTVGTGGTQAFTATGADAYGNAVSTAGTAWAVSPSSLGTMSPVAGSSAVFTATPSPGSGIVTATVGTITGSAAVTVAAKATVPGSPIQLIAATSSRGVSLAWKSPASQGSSPITSYRVYRGSSSGTETLLATVGTALTYTDTSARRGATSYYTVAAINAAGQSPMSAEASARAR